MNSKSKWIISGLLTMSLVSVAAVSNLTEVNQKLSGLLQRFNNPTTKAAVVFTALNTDDKKTLDFGVRANYSKAGKTNKLEIALRNMKYTFGDGQNPKVSGQLVIATDLIKAFSQESINELGDSLADLAKEFASDYGKEYGEALKLDAKLVNVKKDEKGNYKSASLNFYAAIDYAKLPADMPIEKVEFKTLKANIAFNTKGMGGSVEVVMNPKYKGFAIDGDGLKEYIQKLLNNDEATYNEITSVIDYMDRFAENIVNGTGK